MDFSNPLYNPLFVLLISWTVGAVIEPLVRRLVDYRTVQTNLFSSIHTYERIGVPLVRWVIVKLRLNCNPGLKEVPNGQIDTLYETRKALTGAEFSHWIGFAIMMAATLVVAVISESPVAVVASFLVVNVIGNAYLSLVQQYNRIRVDRLIAKTEQRASHGVVTEV